MDNGASIVLVESYAQGPLVIYVMNDPSPPIQWRFTGLSKMTRRLVTCSDDRTRSSGLIAEIVVMPFRRSFIASKKTNIVRSVRINVCVLKWTVRCAWISHVPLMNA